MGKTEALPTIQNRDRPTPAVVSAETAQRYSALALIWLAAYDIHRKLVALGFKHAVR